MIQKKRNNYIDGNFIDVDDFKAEQSYFLDRLRSDNHNLGSSGLMDLQGLEVIPDTVMAEPIAAQLVEIAIDPSPDITAPNPQNFTNFPGFLGGSTAKIYSVFKTTTQNIQRLDLRITLSQANISNQNLDVIIRVQNLIDPRNPMSPLANIPPLAQIQLSGNDIPPSGSDNFLELDFSNENSGQGLAVLKDSFYAISLEYRRPVNSMDNIDIFHNPLDQNDQVEKDLFTWILTGGNFQQGFQNQSGIFQQFQIYHKVSTSALTILPGIANIEGDRVIVEQDQFRFLEIPDRRNLDGNGILVPNYVILRYKELFTDPITIQSTRITANTRIKDSATIEILTQPQWEQLVSNVEDNKYLLLAVVNDSNIVSIFNKRQFNVPSNSTNMAFHDWLNPNNVTPIDEALDIQQSRPTDFIFFVSNIPVQVPLADAFGNIQREPTTVRDPQGNIVRRAGDPVIDDIVRVVVNLSMDNGRSTRTLELAVVSEVGITQQFRNYSATISNLSDNPLDNVFSFNFDTDQLAPNVIYNFVAFTRRGLPIFIQDYNRVLATADANGGRASLRDVSFTTFLDRDSRTIVINEDLQLGIFDPASDIAQPGVVQFVSSLIKSETPTPIGVALEEQIIPVIQTLLPSNSFVFEPVPMVRADQVTKIRTTDTEVQIAYDIGDIKVEVDNGDGLGPVDITFSGLTDRDRGGNGHQLLITGVIDDSVQLDIGNIWEVKSRELLGFHPDSGEPIGGRDNTNRSAAFAPTGPGQVGGPTDVRAFSLLARGFDGTQSPFSNAGFEDGEQVYIYINDRPALDNNNNAISFVFDENISTYTLPTVHALGVRQYFREKQILSIQNTTLATPGRILIDTGLDASGNSRDVGQVIFNDAEIPTAINSNAIVTIQYSGIEATESDIDFFKTRFKPIGTRDGFRISNTNIVSSAQDFISVPEAFALTTNTNQQQVDSSTFPTAAIFVDGINITSLISPIGRKTIVADDGTTLLPGQVAFNPEEGTIKFFKQYDSIANKFVSEAPSNFTRLSVTYFRLDTRFVFHTSTNVSYDPRYDINSDGHIDELDLNLFNRAFGSQIGDINYLAAADFNNDGEIDDTDLQAFREHFGAVALGEMDFEDATSIRLGSILVVKEDNFLTQVKLVRAVSRAPDSIAPNGRTVLFLDETTPINDAGNYIVTFGFAAALSLGFIQTEVETERPLIGSFNLNNIKMFETVDPLNTREIIQVQTSPLPNANNRFDSLLTFTPAINISSEFTIRSIWSPEGLAIINRAELIIPQKYELLDRKVYGPFSLEYSHSDFENEGTGIEFVLRATDATLADGSVDSTGTHIGGVPLSELVFTVHLTIPNEDAQTSTIWTWHNIQPSGLDNKIKLEFNENLFIDHRIQGKNGQEVLTPFGLGSAQVALKPQYTGGDLKNDLSNISVMRSDNQSRFVKPHDHSNEREGGVLTTASVQFRDELARLSTGNMTEVVYKLLDIIEQQQREINLIRAIEGVIRWDSGLFWDDPNIFWDSN